MPIARIGADLPRPVRTGKSSMHELTAYVRDVPDFPKPGVLFKDLAPLLANARALGLCIGALAAPCAAKASAWSAVSRRAVLRWAAARAGLRRRPW